MAGGRLQKSKALSALVLLCLALAASASRAGAAAAPGKMVVAHAAMNARVAPLWAAQDLGFFSKYGVDSDTIFIRQAPVLIAALTAGDIPVGYTGGTAALGAAVGGIDLRVIAAFTSRVGYDIVVAPGIRSAKDLRGKRFGVQSLGGTLWMGAILGLEHLGLDPVRDKINFLVVGDQTVMAQALEGGTIDATVLDGVFSRRLKQKGFTILAELYRANIPFNGQGVIVKKSYLQEHPERVEAFMKGLIEGLVFALAPRNKPAVVDLIMRRLRISERNLAEEGYQDLLRGTERKPYPQVEGMRNIQRLMKLRNPAVEKLKAEELVDDRLLRRLDESGFIDKLYSAAGVK